MNPYITQILQMIVAVLLAPLLSGWVKALKCRFQGRTSPGLLRPYKDIMKLFSKEIVLAKNASWIFRFTPYLVFGVTVLASAIVPMLTVDLPLGPTADVIALVALFAIARFFTALSAMDTGTAFGGMGASREMTIASLAEPAMLMAIFTVSLANGTTSLAEIAGNTLNFHGGIMLRPSLAFALLSFTLISLAETGRIPVDNPATHLELTMIHEAMILEYSGPHLALIEWASMIKLLLFISMGSAFFLPWGIAGHGATGSLVIAFVVWLLKLGTAGIFLVIIETVMAKMRLFRMTEFIGSAFLFATLGMISFFILE